MSLLTVARDLHRRKARERSGHFVAEGLRTVEELLRSGLPVDGILVAESARAVPRAAHGTAAGRPQRVRGRLR